MENPTIRTSLAFARVGAMLVLSYRHRQGPSDTDWRAWMERLRVRDFDKLLVSSPFDVIGPNAGQRRAIAEYWNHTRGARPRVARLTDSRLVAGAYTALGWVLEDLQMRVFTRSDLPAALAWLGSEANAKAVSALLFELGTNGERAGAQPLLT
jgi:hypothetical protein